jgi:uncharacterized protein YqgV (UPF0045/DUF77 family)
MQLTAEMSLYPLAEDYIPVIQAFIEQASTHPGMEIVTNAMSTQVCGEYDAVFELVRDTLARSHAAHGKQVLVCKFIVGDLNLGEWEG